MPATAYLFIFTYKTLEDEAWAMTELQPKVVSVHLLPPTTTFIQNSH